MDQHAAYGGNPSEANRILVVTAVAAEKDALARGLPDCGKFEVIAAGVGAAAAAAGTAKALASGGYGLVVSAGIGGGFAGKAGIGSLVVASELVAADLGAESPDGFLSVDELGFGASRIPVDADLANALAAGLTAAGLSAVIGPVLTVTTATGTAETAAMLTERIPGAVAEAMEGYGAGAAALAYGVPVLEIRAISNRIGPRDRDSWRIADALKALEAASCVLSEVL